MKTVKMMYAARDRKLLSRTGAEGLILKELPSNLKYDFLEPEKRKPVIISTALTESEE